MLNVSIFGNTADIFSIVHLVPHACQHLLNAIFGYYCLLAANQGNYVRGLFLKKKILESFSIGVRITTTRCVVYSLRFFLNMSRPYE
jgi:hypothetical protein